MRKEMVGTTARIAVIGYLVASGRYQDDQRDVNPHQFELRDAGFLDREGRRVEMAV
jgi:hypothetical protein